MSDTASSPCTSDFQNPILDFSSSHMGASCVAKGKCPNYYRYMNDIEINRRW